MHHIARVVNKYYLQDIETHCCSHQHHLNNSEI